MYIQTLIIATIFAHSDQFLYWNNEAEVILNFPEKSKIRDARVFEDSQCKTPRKNKRYYFNCKPTNVPRFPAHEAQCSCSNCSLNFLLTCNDDDKWYSNIINPCDFNNEQYRCGVCKYTQIKDKYRCDLVFDGYVNETRKCYCRSNCEEHALTCYQDGWKQQDYVGCDVLDSPMFHHDPILHMKKTFYRGSYTYTCEPGYKLYGPESKTCHDGVISDQEEVKCIQVDVNMKKSDERTRSHDSYTTESHNNRGLLIAIVVIMITLGVGLSLYLVHGKYKRRGPRKLPAVSENVADNEAVYETVDNQEYSVAYYAVSQSSD